MRYALKSGCAVVIENPKLSLLWNIPALAGLANDPSAQVTIISQCCFAEPIQKRTKLLSFNLDLSSLATKCKRGARVCHYSGVRHVPLGSSSEVLVSKGAQKVFLTSLASKYPWGFCRRIVSLLAAKCRPTSLPTRGGCTGGAHESKA